MRARHHQAATSAAALRDVQAWRRQSNRLAVLANTDTPSALRGEYWQLARQCELLAAQMRRAAVGAGAVLPDDGHTCTSSPARLQCARCSGMADRLLQMQCELIESRAQVLEWHELFREVDSALQKLLACRSTPKSCAAELQQLQHRMAGHAEAAPMPGPRCGQKAGR